MTRNRLTSSLTVDQLRQHNSLTDKNERQLFLESLYIIDQTPTTEQAAQILPLPQSFLGDKDLSSPVQQALADTWEQLLTDYAAGKDKRDLRELVNQLLRQQQQLLQQEAEIIHAVMTPLVSQHQTLTQAIDILRGQVLKTADVEQIISQQITANLQDVPGRLSEAVEGFVRKMVPAVVRVENPSEGLLRLTRYLTAGLVIAGLGLGGLFFWGLTRQAKIAEQTPGWTKYQYLYQKAQAEGDRKLLNDLDQAEQLYTSDKLTQMRIHLEKINAARRQQRLSRQEENEHQQQIRRSRP